MKLISPYCPSDCKYSTLFYLTCHSINLDIISYVQDPILDRIVIAYMKLNFVNPIDYIMHHQFKIQHLYALPTLYLCVLFLSEKKRRLVSQYKLMVFITEMKSVYSAVRTGPLNKAVCASSLKG
jgi:hypothetical protein